MPVEVVRLVNPRALLLEPIQKLFRDALATAPSFMGSLEEAGAEYAMLLTQPRCGVFVGVEKGKYKGLAVVLLPDGKIIPMAQCWVFYSKGTKALKTALIKAIVDFGLQNGYTKLWAVNGSKVSDAVWSRAFKGAGTLTKVGSIVEFAAG